MKVLMTLSGKIVKIGLAAEFHRVMNKIYYLETKSADIIKVAEVFFEALDLYRKYKRPELYIFLYGNDVRNRLNDAFSRKNEIDGELMQQKLNSDPKLAKAYKQFNKDYIKLANPPAEWSDKNSEEFRILKNHFKQERGLFDFKRFL